MTLAHELTTSYMPEDVTDEMVAKITEICLANRGKPGALIPVLQSCQEVAGYLPVEVQELISDKLGVPGHEVYGVVSFYSFFSMVPRGRNSIRICMGTACYVRGGKEALERMERHLDIPVDSTTPDRRYTLEQVRCLGACGLAPVMTINQDTHRKVMADSVIEIIEAYE